MTMLTHTRGLPRRIATSSRGRDPFETDAAAACLAVIKRVLLRALMMVAAGCALVAVMAVKIAVYLPHLVHH